jgi:hypothetical protein
MCCELQFKFFKISSLILYLWARKISTQVEHPTSVDTQKLDTNKNNFQGQIKARAFYFKFYHSTIIPDLTFNKHPSLFSWTDLEKAFSIVSMCVCLIVGSMTLLLDDNSSK